MEINCSIYGFQEIVEICTHRHKGSELYDISLRSISQAKSITQDTKRGSKIEEEKNKGNQHTSF